MGKNKSDTDDTTARESMSKESARKEKDPERKKSFKEDAKTLEKKKDAVKEEIKTVEKKNQDSEKKRESAVKKAEKEDKKMSLERKKSASSKSEREDLKSERSKRVSPKDVKDTKDVKEATDATPKLKEKVRDVKSAKSRAKDDTKSKDDKTEERGKSPPKQVERKKSSKAEVQDGAEVKKTKPRKDKDLDSTRPVSSGRGSPKAAMKRPDPAKNKTKTKKSIIIKSRLALPVKKKKKIIKMESIMLTISKLSAFLNENSDSLFDGPSLPHQSSFTGADMDDITSMDRDELEKSYKILKTVIADMERKLIRERERAKAMPKAMSNVPTSLEANMNLRYQYQKALDMERENYVKLEKENQKLAAQMRVIEMKAFKFKKAQSVDEQTVHIQEVNVLKNKIRDLDLRKDKESEDHNRTLAQLEKIIKERDKLANEIIQMRRLQIHISHQLSERYTANSEGEAEAETEAEHEHEYRSGRPEGSAKSSKSVKFAKQNSIRKTSEYLVKPTAASEARVLAAKEKLKEKTNEVAAIAKLREIKKKRSSIQPHINETNVPEDDDYSSVHESIVEEESMIEPEVGDDDQISDHNSYTRSSVSSNYSHSQSFNQSHPVSTDPSSISDAVPVKEQ